MWYLCRLSSIKTWIKNHHSIPATKKVVVPLTKRKVAAGAAATVKNHLKEMGLVMIHAATVHAKTTADQVAEKADSRKKNLTVNQQEDLKVQTDLVKVTLQKVTDLHAHLMVQEAQRVEHQTANRITQNAEAILGEIANDHLVTVATDQIADQTEHRTSRLAGNQEQTVPQADHMVLGVIADHPAEKTVTDRTEKVKEVSVNHLVAQEQRAMLVAKVLANAHIRTEANVGVKVDREKNSESRLIRTKSVGDQKKSLMLMVRTNQCLDLVKNLRQTSIKRKKDPTQKRKTGIWKMMVTTGK
jgi:hypothetical protein